MMSLLGQWFGFDTDASSSTPPSRSQPALTISSPKKSAPHPETGTGTPLRKTKSDELLRDFEVMRFLTRIDERLKQQGALLSRSDLDRLQTLHVQALTDNCDLLADIIDHFEMEHDKLRLRLAAAGPSSMGGPAGSATVSPHLDAVTV